VETVVKVAVLMSTYNGEKYLSEQINSILSQKNVELSLFIRDDGSRDQTINIIRNFQRDHSNIHLIEGDNLGVGNSFMCLVYRVPSDFDYYTFSDQDDVWLDDKIVSAINALEENSTANLYCSNQTLIDKNGNRIGVRFNQKPDVSCEQSFSINHITGCTMVWNQKLQILLQDKKRRPSKELLESRIHDVWVGVVAGFTGNVIYDSNSYILYRQHENNVVGAKEDGPIETLKWQIRKLKDPTIRNGRSLIAKEVCERFPEYTINHPLLKEASNAETFSGRMKILHNSAAYRSHTKEGSISFAVKVLFGFF
jgi:glycosyltransferase involved in cell wall biosynthesis